MFAPGLPLAPTGRRWAVLHLGAADTPSASD
jgi:hypothetical protein